ncbi:MAG TPA: ATP-dependent protease ATPase subunit HslU [Bacteroidota bacterium]|jgi:ATP-dependent HslUV protease ATP-binding subunit HslU|nr:ATP-dependent protease ATPase subunit HslU [Bacteroidota bacterium]
MNRKHQKELPRELTPREIVRELDRYIIGQQAAKKSVAIAIRNRWRRLQTPEHMREEIMPNNIIMIGPTGVGKTEIARRLAKLVNAPFLKVEASKFTEVGYVGRDVESIIRDLTEFAVNMLKGEKAVEVQEKAMKLAEDRILDILVPPVRRHQPVVAEAESATEHLLDTDDAKTTREKFREKLRRGELEERTLEIDVTTGQLPSMHVFGPVSMEEMGVNIQEMFGNMLPKRTKKRKVTVDEARQFLIHEESQKLIDSDALVKEAIMRVENSGIVFIDEIDKVAGEKGHSGGPDVSREGVQRDLLPVVEGTAVMTKYGLVRSDHILFIASGAFHVSKPSDLIPELQGRFPIRVELNSLTEQDFVKILTIPQNALIKQYSALLETDGVKLEFAPDGIREIAATAAEVNDQVENIGARRLHTIMTTLLEEILFETPEKFNGSSILVTKEMVEERLSDIVKNKDLSRYIL